MATPSNIQLQKGAITPAQTEQTGTKSAVSLIDSLLTQPSLPQGTSIQPQAQNIQSNELLATPGVTGTLSATSSQAVAPTAAMGTAATTQQIAAATPQTASQFSANVVGTAPTMTAAQGTVSAPMTAAQQSLASIDSRATVQGQLENISQDIETSLAQGTPLPAFARGAAEAAKATMQSRGLGASTMLAEALAEGILKSSVPIAAADAETYKQVIFQNLANNQQAAVVNAQAYLQMDMANLSNSQQANLQNLHSRQQILLSDQAARNASLQFNATNVQQSEQFFSNLKSGIELQNAQRSDAMNQFSTAEGNKINAMNVGNNIAVNEANAARQNAINQFNSQLQDSRDKFNGQMKFAVDQSNAQWRRQINTTNTAVQNETNRINVQNSYNASQAAQNFLWQKMRDNAQFNFQKFETYMQRQHEIGLLAMEFANAEKLYSRKQRDLVGMKIGEWLANWITGKAPSIGGTD